MIMLKLWCFVIVLHAIHNKLVLQSNENEHNIIVLKWTISVVMILLNTGLGYQSSFLVRACCIGFTNIKCQILFLNKNKSFFPALPKNIKIILWEYHYVKWKQFLQTVIMLMCTRLKLIMNLIKEQYLQQWRWKIKMKHKRM